jgi:hypothetical protein
MHAGGACGPHMAAWHSSWRSGRVGWPCAAVGTKSEEGVVEATLLTSSCNDAGQGLAPCRRRWDWPRRFRALQAPRSAPDNCARCPVSSYFYLPSKPLRQLI